jgi:hypothetical protein
MEEKTFEDYKLMKTLNRKQLLTQLKIARKALRKETLHFEALRFHNNMIENTFDQRNPSLGEYIYYLRLQEELKEMMRDNSLNQSIQLIKKRLWPDLFSRE